MSQERPSRCVHDRNFEQCCGVRNLRGPDARPSALPDVGRPLTDQAGAERLTRRAACIVSLLMASMAAAGGSIKRPL